MTVTGNGKPFRLSVDDTFHGISVPAKPAASVCLVDAFTTMIDWAPVAGLAAAQPIQAFTASPLLVARVVGKTPLAVSFLKFDLLCYLTMLLDKESPVCSQHSFHTQSCSNSATAAKDKMT